MAESDSVVSGLSDAKAHLYTDASSTTEFSSPYTAYTLDNIPTPILEALVMLGPTISILARISQIVTWNTTKPRESVLAVLIWVGCCLWIRTVLLALPAIVLVKLGRDWLQVRTARTRREKMEQQRLAERQRREHERQNDDDYYEDDKLRQQRHAQQQEEEEELLVSRKFQQDDQVSLDDTLRDLNAINDVILRCRRVAFALAERLDGARPEMVASALSVLGYVWPVWLLLNLLMTPSQLIAFLGALVLVAPSPWFKVTVLTLRRNTLLMHLLASLWAYGVAMVVTAGFVPVSSLFGAKPEQQGRARTWFSRFLDRYRREKQKSLEVLQDDLAVEKDAHVARSEMIFQFEVYENQRWWLGMNWTTNMMPSERNAWTDKTLAPIPSKESFELPETSRSTQYRPDGDNAATRLTTSKTWTWADGDWWVDMTGELQDRVDKNGWEYGNNAWQQMSGVPGMHTFTRRRRWCRRAKLVERRIEEQVKDQAALSETVTSNSTSDIGHGSGSSSSNKAIQDGLRKRS